MNAPPWALLLFQDPPAYQASGGWSMVTWVGILIAMGLMPFVFTMITSFAKLVVVGGILRQALGTPQIPPTSVITGLSLILTVHIMSPVVLDTWNGYQREMQAQQAGLPAGERLDETARVRTAVAAAEAPLEGFLKRHTSPSNVELFRSLLARLGARNQTPPPERGGRFELVAVYAPAFLLTELTEAFQIGFLIFVPFLVIDLVVSNILLAMGMHMLSPTTVSLPLKLLLFVLIDGWSLILKGIVLGYA